MVWLLTVGFIFLVFLITIDKGAYLHSDEFVIIDLGKSILNSESNSSIAWLIELQQPAFLVSYLGVVFQEVVYENIGQFGPRIFSLLGAIAAATSLVGFLIAKGIFKRFVFPLGLIFIFDPLIVQAFTIGRIDGWAMFFCLSSCWVLRETQYFYSRKLIFNFRLLLAGVLASLAILTWPSAIFLYPLIILELFRLARKSWENGGDFNESFSFLLVFIFGGIMSIILFLIPISGQIFSQLDLVKETIDANSHAGSSNVIDIHSIKGNLTELLRILKFSPFVVFFVLISGFKLKQAKIFLAIIVVIAVMAFTLVYINRVQYLIPYFIVAISSMFYKGCDYSFPRILRIGGISILLFWSVGLSLGVRTYLAFEGQYERERALLNHAALSMVGPGEKKVYIPYEFYYSGRSLKWSMYRAYIAQNSTLKLENWKKVLSLVDYVIMHEYSKGFEMETLNEGFVDKGIFHLYDEPPLPFNGITDNEVRIRNLFSIFRKPYGPYRLYTREIKK
ncbi:hypothetical protein [Cyclobacterium jeungdonense]|uniref:Glycosyltransferase RgtA/B/C/D-like domain-containing protein n=1 Tax=Cyclobacterium jeungdonense TaxID=708087 RepID=A0ABT8C9X0_9BACT|nr:hypothetical protein [Cyclobacterium jeungdonense]MDN3688887.1 hypothetical protein [Cyclobacterium jeungdonense]